MGAVQDALRETIDYLEKNDPVKTVVPQPRPADRYAPINHAEEAPPSPIYQPRQVVQVTTGQAVPTPVLVSNKRKAPYWSQLTDQQHQGNADYFLQSVPDVSVTMVDYRPMEWLVEGMLPVGGLVLLGGKAKLGRKSLFVTALALAIASDGVDFLDRPTRHGPVVFSNLEDGYLRCVRRMHNFGTRVGDFDPNGKSKRRNAIFFVTHHDQLKYVPSLLMRYRVAAVVVDPFVELANYEGLDDENDAGQVAWFLRGWRDLGQASGALILMTHHFRKAGDQMRGSSALEGACDGWLELHHMGDGRPHVLQATPRDGEPFELEVEVKYEGDQVQARPVTPARRQSDPGKRRQQLERAEEKAQKEAAQEKAKDGPTPDYVIYKQLLDFFSSNRDTCFTQTELKDVVSCKPVTLKRILSTLRSDGNVESKGRKGWQWALGDGDVKVIMGQDITAKDLPQGA